MLAPVEAEPAHVGLDGVDVFLLFLGRIGIVEAQMAAAAEFLGDAEIQADRLGVADMQIAVRLRRKARDNLGVLLGVEIGLNDVANEIAPCLGRRCLCRRHSAGILHVGFRSYVPNPQACANPAWPVREALFMPRT